MKKSNWFFVAGMLGVTQTEPIFAAMAAFFLIVFGFGYFLNGE